MQLLTVEHPLRVGVDDGEVGVGADLQRPLLWVHPPQLGGPRAVHVRPLFEREPSLRGERRHRAHLGFEADEPGDALPGVGERFVDVFLLVGVGCVVGRDAVDGVVVNPDVPQKLALLGVPNRRLDAGDVALLLHDLLGEPEILRTGLGGDVHAVCFPARDQFRARARGEVEHVDWGVGVVGQQDDAGDGLGLGDDRPRMGVVDGPIAALLLELRFEMREDGVVLLVEADALADRCGVLHRLVQFAVVRRLDFAEGGAEEDLEAWDARFGEGNDLVVVLGGQHGVGLDVDVGVVFGNLVDLLDGLRRVDHRIGVGHRDDRRHPAGRGGGRGARPVFLVLVAR